MKAKKNISCNDQIDKTCSEYFINIPNLNMSSYGYKYSDSSGPDPILRIIDKSMGHPSIKLIKAKNNSRLFNFTQINIEEFKKSYRKLDPKKVL